MADLFNQTPELPTSRGSCVVTFVKGAHFDIHKNMRVCAYMCACSMSLHGASQMENYKNSAKDELK